MKNQSCNEMLEFIGNCPEAFHTIKTVKTELNNAGFVEIPENKIAEMTPGGKYYTVRNLSSLIAFVIPKEKPTGFNICASHTDNPAFKLKTVKTQGVGGSYSVVPVEKYGGMSFCSWLDRPLGISGRVVTETDSGVKTSLVSLDGISFVIPSVAIHMNRKLNEGVALNPAKDLLPLFSCPDKPELLERMLAEKFGGKILGMDLYLHSAEKGCYAGAENEFICSPRLDDLECVFGSLKGFLKSTLSSAVPVLCLLDNEEVGSQTKQGAASGFLYDTLEKIAESVGLSKGEFRAILADSFMVSADNAHAKHPNHPELADTINPPVLNGGVVIKHNAEQRYTTDALSCAVFEELCHRAGVKTQHYTNRADIPGGSTLGSIADTAVSINTVDIGLAQLSMHSCMETAGADDIEYMIEALKLFFSTPITGNGNGEYKIG